MAVSPKRSFGRYEVISPIGAGGMGEVFLAFDSRLDRKVAIKTLGEEFCNDKERLGRFIREAKSASALNHPNILTIHEIRKEKKLNYIVSEYVKGKTLKKVIRQSAPSIAETLAISVQVASALAAAHEAGIVHRDIKPDNLMIRDDGIVKVVDFGVAKINPKTFGAEVNREAATLTKISTEPGMMIGTPRYMSPEQARGQAVDHRSDVFSLGVVIYEMVAGKPPFAGGNVMDIVSSILKDEPQPLRDLNPDVPAALEKIVGKTLRKERDERYQDIKDLLIDLRDLKDELKFNSKGVRRGESTNIGPIHHTDADKPESTMQTASNVVSERRFNLFHAVAFVAVIATVLVSLWWSGILKTSESGPARFKTTEVASWSSAPGELFSDAAFSPDGKLIAFSSTKSNSKNIWVTQSGSTEAIQITKDLFRNKDPIWAPKGDEIAYFSERGNEPGVDTPGAGIWRVSALGGTPRSVGELKDGGSRLRRWTDSGRIYYQSEGDLYYIDTSKGDSGRFTGIDDAHGKVDWITISKDEKQIAYVTNAEDRWSLWVKPVGDADPKRIADSRGKIDGVAWLPEKQRFHYSALAEGNYQIFAVEAGDSEPVQLTNSVSNSVVFDASPDGTSILFGSSREESDIWRVDLDTKDESPVVGGVGSELWPSVSPDSRAVVFQSVKNLSRGNHLFDSSSVVKVASSDSPSAEPTILAEGGFLPQFSPDGKQIAFMRFSGKTLGIFSININGGSARLLTEGGIPSLGYSVSPYNRVQSAVFSWSPDGTRIAYVSDRGGARNVWTVKANSKDDSRLTGNTDPGVSIYCPIWTADGKSLAFYSQTKQTTGEGKTVRGLWVFRPEEGKAKRILSTDELIRLIGWSEDENSLLYAGSDKFRSLPPEVHLASVNIETGKTKSVASLADTYFYNIHLSPDRARIAFVARKNEKDDIWLIPSNGGRPVKTTGNNDSRMNFSSLAWSKDGGAIFFGKQARFSLLSMITELK